MDTSGNVITTFKAEGTNHHLIGMEECRKRIADLVNKAKIKAKIPLDTPLLALGLSLSGCELEESNNELVEGLKEKYPNLSPNIAIGSDTEGSVAATSSNGGLVSIAGTGSNTLLINPDGTRSQCGGWGYLLGDEGSAWDIAHRSIKTCFDAIDNLETPPHPIDAIWKKVQEYFDIVNQPDLLNIFYGPFCKAKIAGFCKEVSKLAGLGDPLAIHIFQEAGRYIAKSISAVYPKASPELTDRVEGLQVACVGSVWLSWCFLKEGFVRHIENNTDIDKLLLIRVISPGGLGAAYMACDKLKIDVSRNYEENYEILFRYERNRSSCKCIRS
ncbi:N-acetyl-D-glucosamine kinase isoform X2 [Coccinella septempunctata]|nr:N-acetyl-D-glucosamine kinase isoform X2 [Coccinella septempunctata]